MVRPVPRLTELARNPIVGGPSRNPAYPSVEAAATPPGLASSPAAAGPVTAELHALRLIRVETGPGDGSHGRPSHRLLIHPEGPVTIAAQIHPDGFEVALVGLGGRIIAVENSQAEIPGDPARALAPLAEAAGRLLRQAGRRCAGAALAVASAVSQPEGATVAALYLGWPDGAKVRDIFAELAEHRHGAGQGASTLLVVASGRRGVGEHGVDPRVRAAAAVFIEHLGLGLAGLVNVLNPDRILLGGLHGELLRAAPDPLRTAVAERSPWGRGAAVPILPCTLDHGGLIGAAELAWQPVLDDPAILA